MHKKLPLSYYNINCLESVPMVWELPQMEPGRDVIFMHIFNSSGMPWRKYLSWPWATTIHPLVSSSKPSNSSWFSSQPVQLEDLSIPALADKRCCSKGQQATLEPPLHPLQGDVRSVLLPAPSATQGNLQRKASLIRFLLRTNGTSARMLGAYMCNAHSLLHTHLRLRALFLGDPSAPWKVRIF